MAQPWLDDLSEDWVAPDSPSPSPAHSAPGSASRNGTPGSARRRSRLPLPRTTSASFSEIPVRSLGKGNLHGRSRNALAERSRSENNISSPVSDTSRLPRPTSHSFSASSTNSVIHNGTVDQRPRSGPVGRSALGNNTPEWRRRLLKGELGYSEQRDLFSPMGLESIFQKPAENSEKSKEVVKGRKLPIRDTTEAMASSPPPWHGKEKESDAHGRTDSPSNARCSIPSCTDRKPSPAQIQGPKAIRLTSRTESELENENFSPVLLPMNHQIGGTVNLAALNSIGSNGNGVCTVITSTTHQQRFSRVETLQYETQDDPSYSKTEDTLPEDLPVGTPEVNSEVMDVGTFVTTKRGGFSQDGSFHRRPLSASVDSKPFVESDEEDGSVVHNKNAFDPRRFGENKHEAIPDTDSHSPSQEPVTPKRNPRSKSQSPSKVHLSASPLKLFDAHDTFTSNRLQRRLSQLEDKAEDGKGNGTQGDGVENSNVKKKRPFLTSVDEERADQDHPGEPNQVQSSPVHHHHPQSRLSAFGKGQFDDYQFSSEISVFTSPERSMSFESPSLHVPAPGSRQPTRYHQRKSSLSQIMPKVKREGLVRISNPFQAQPKITISEDAQKESTEEPVEHVEYPEGKRGPTSPTKHRTPKRRRTIVSLNELNEDGADDSDLSATKDTRIPMQPLIGKKRRDSRHDQTANIADPEILARRHILRPRNPTPSQRRREDIQAEVLEATEAFILSSPQLNTIQEQLTSSNSPEGHPENSRATAIANEVAAYSLQRAPKSNRKRSVTTQDFLDEAVKIMEFIRTKGRPTNGLASLEETESEVSKFRPEDTPSSPLTFSRPPTREGQGQTSAWRQPNKRELDARVLSHLEKFQEKDSDTFMAASLRSLHIGRLNDRPEQESRGIVVEHNNIRITDNHSRGEHDNGANGSGGRSPSGSPTIRSHHSTRSFGKTIVTNSSRRSDHVATLAPEAVAHLIPERVGGMSFDREKGIWVKQKEPSREIHPEGESSAVNASEDDPFGNIPDLTVDETKEMLMKESSPRRPTSQQQFMDSTQPFESPEKTRPSTRDGRVIPPADTSSAPSKVSGFAWSFPKTETRATSWSEQEPKTQTLATSEEEQEAPLFDRTDDDIEHEIRYYENRHTTAQRVTSGRLRDITISFASPALPTRNPVGNPSEAYSRNPQPTFNSTRNASIPIRQPPSSRTNRTRWRSDSDLKTFPTTRVNPVTEDGELSILETQPGNYQMKLSMKVSALPLETETPARLAPIPFTPARMDDATFMLSDLPDFTVHQVDESELPNRVVVKNHGGTLSRVVEDRYAGGTADLVKALQDVEPDEPYWEDLRRVDLHGKGLSNVYRLDEFCFRLEELDMSENEISQLKGIPASVRRLNIRDNCLTGLNSWATLMNLQHLEISGNELDSLEGLGQLIHLRTLRVDRNKLRSLHGILELDGLIELSAEGNCIESVDFKRSNLLSLTDLNLKGNGLVELRDLHCVPRLQNLNLDNNSLCGFPGPEETTPCPSLRVLSLNKNRLTSLSIENFPALETLSVDCNSLTHINGLSQSQRLRLLSGRNQSIPESPNSPAPAMFFLQNAEVTSISLSLNATRFLSLPHHLLNLQRLEMASMGMRELPDDFGHLVPNVRSLNLNFNAITDLRPLLNIKKLDELLLAGNKIARLRMNLVVLGKLATVRRLDMRENPITLRFYPPAVDQRVLSLTSQNGKGEGEGEEGRFELPDADPESDRLYVERLDDETRLRRRVHEMLVANSCPGLRWLDGRGFEAGGTMVKDGVWERLLELGVIRRAGKVSMIEG